MTYNSDFARPTSELVIMRAYRPASLAIASRRNHDLAVRGRLT